MNKTDLLQPSIEKFLFRIDFINRYKKISDRFAEKNDSFKYDKSDVEAILHDLGVNVIIYDGDQYFTDFESLNGYKFRFGLTIKYNIVEFDITIINETLNIKSGGSWGLLVQLMTDWKENIKKPGFGNYEQLKMLLFEAIKLYSDIKLGLVQGLA